MQLDDIDGQILEALQDDGRMKNKDIAKRIGLSESACRERIRNLERCGIIVGYRVILNHAAMGAPFEVWGEVALSEQSLDAETHFSNLLLRTRAVLSAYRIAGKHDFLVHAVGPSMNAWESLIRGAHDEGISIASATPAVVIGHVKSDRGYASGNPPLRLVVT